MDCEIRYDVKYYVLNSYGNSIFKECPCFHDLAEPAGLQHNVG